MLTTSADLASFQSLVQERCGLSPEAYRVDTLSDAIHGRMAQCGLSRPADYCRRLRQDRAELGTFAGLLTVKETFFMRESAHFDLLARRLLGEMLAARTMADPVRILAAGCSTGEEPYSLMIALLESYGALIGGRVSIIGVDIDREALARAEQAVYGRGSLRAMPDPLLRKYFEPLGGDRHRLKDSVREGVRFVPLNLLSDGYPDSLVELDVIFYRNVSIYFEPPTQKRVFTRLAGLLKHGGWLFVSSTETLSHDHGVLALAEVGGVFCYRKVGGVALGDRRTDLVVATKEPPPPLVEPVRPAGPIPEVSASLEVHLGERQPESPRTVLPPPRVDRPRFDEALSLARQKRHEEALACIDQQLIAEPSFVKGYMLKAGILVNLRQTEDARRVCLQGLEEDPWCLEGHLLLGLMARADENDGEALGLFRHAVYIQPSCWLAHFHLAQIHAARQEVANARREYEVVLRLLEKGSLEKHGLSFFPLAFPAEQIARLCRHNLATLGPPKA